MVILVWIMMWFGMLSLRRFHGYMRILRKLKSWLEAEVSRDLDELEELLK
jgi:hypothetical protein